MHPLKELTTSQYFAKDLLRANNIPVPSNLDRRRDQETRCTQYTTNMDTGYYSSLIIFNVLVIKRYQVWLYKKYWSPCSRLWQTLKICMMNIEWTEIDYIDRWLLKLTSAHHTASNKYISIWTEQKQYYQSILSL